MLHGRLLSFIQQPLGKRIDQRAIEQWASTFWKLQRHGGGTRSNKDNKPFVIMFPPPNITGNLHLGHALTGAIQDALVRHKRMQGYECFFIPGFDHAGLATQNIVEKMLWKQKGLTRQQFGRKRFVCMANKWKEQKLSEMRGQLDRLGLELTHSREYFTMDANSSLAVHAAFKQLFRDGIIYRSTKPIFWSKQLQTTLSDIEVERTDGVDRYVRTGEAVERRPISQWFIKAEEMASNAVKVVENGSIDMIPPNYKNSWYSWLVGNGVEDWCISRQSWWGHRIPAYKLKTSDDNAESWVVADCLNEAKTLLNAEDESEVVQDPDVLDTWFSSSLLPLTISGWPDEEKFSASLDSGQFPLQVMETGFDILTFWVSKMTMISLALTRKVPFKLVLLHGMICDSDGKKMSKSRGNIIDPLDVIDGATLQDLQNGVKESYTQGILEESRLQPVLDSQKKLFPQGIPLCGADGLRAYLLSHDVLEEVVKIQIGQIDKIRRLSNKIWNVYRFVLSLKQSEQFRTQIGLQNVDICHIDKSELDETDRQVLKALAYCVNISHEVFNVTYEFHFCFKQLELFWVVHLSHEYIEKVKDVLIAKKGSLEERKRRFQVLSISLLTSIKLMHPFMPHLTEYLYQKLAVLDNDFNSSSLNDSAIRKDQLLSHQPFPEEERWKDFLQ